MLTQAFCFMLMLTEKRAFHTSFDPLPSIPRGYQSFRLMRTSNEELICDIVKTILLQGTRHQRISAERIHFFLSPCEKLSGCVDFGKPFKQSGTFALFADLVRYIHFLLKILSYQTSNSNYFWHGKNDFVLQSLMPPLIIYHFILT